MGTTKETKVLKTIESQITEGYAIYNTSDKQYTDNYRENIDETNEIYIYETQEEAQDAIEETDYPTDFEIHKIKMTFDVLKVIKRKVVYAEDEE